MGIVTKNIRTKSLTVIIVTLLLSSWSCIKKTVDFVDASPIREEAPTYIPDSPIWRKLNSPSRNSFRDGFYKTEPENLSIALMCRPDTLNDYLKIDNESSLLVYGNIDANTIVSGAYFPRGQYWNLGQYTGKQRYDPILMGPFAITSRQEVIYFNLFGGGYSFDESYPNGINVFRDFWLRSDFNLNGDIISSYPITSFMANNAGYILENNEGKQVWYINNGRIYYRRKPFPGKFYDKFLTANNRVNRKEFGFVMNESKNENIKTKEFYQYNTDTDEWIRKADFPGEDRMEGTMFGVDDKIYYGLGQSKTEPKGFRDIWEYNSQTNLWSKFATYPGSANIKITTALVRGKVYIGLGFYVGVTAIKTEKYIGVSDFWEFVPSRR